MTTDYTDEDIDTLRLRLGTIEHTVDDLVSRITAQRLQIDALESRIAALEQTLERGYRVLNPT